MELNSRVQDKDGFRGFVRYIGSVASSKSVEAIYCGVEWDIASRGKGDGSVTSLIDGQIVRYFSVSQSGATASFVKPELLNCGVPLDIALDERYNDKTEYEGASLVSSSGKSTVPVLLVGDAKIRAQQALGKLQTATLRMSLVAGISPGSLRELCPKLREVDLRGNLLRNWGSGGVSELGRELPNLRILSLADNKLENLTDEIANSLQGCFPQLQTLILTETNIGWAHASRLDRMCPVLEELHLAKNGITKILETSHSLSIHSVLTSISDTREDGSCVASSLFKNLKTLNLSDNKGLQWNEIYALRSLESLSWLILNDCSISQVWTLPLDRNILLGIDPTSLLSSSSSSSSNISVPLPFAKLEQLSLTGNKLMSLSSIDALDSFPVLNTLRISHSDISDASLNNSINIDGNSSSTSISSSLGPSEARQLVVARCPRITTFNGSEVRAREREDAEKAYARKIGNIFSTSENVTGVTTIFGALLAPEAAEMNPYGAVNMGVFSGSGSTLDADAAHIAAAAISQKTTLVVNAPSGFSKGSDSGVIKSKTPTVDRSSVFVTSPVPLMFVSRGGGKSALDSSSFLSSSLLVHSSSPPYVPELDPWGLGVSNVQAAGKLQRLFPRYFLMAARYELHAPAIHAAASAGTLASSVATVLLRSMAGGSCTIEPQTKKLPLSMEVGALRQLCAKLFKAQDASLLRLSFRDRSAGDAYPSLLEDETKPLSYYGVPCEGAEILVEEIDPVEAARQRAAEEVKKELRAKEQEAQGEALRRATEQGIQAGKRAVAN